MLCKPHLSLCLTLLIDMSNRKSAKQLCCDSIDGLVEVRTRSFLTTTLSD